LVDHHQIRTVKNSETIRRKSFTIRKSHFIIHAKKSNLLNDNVVGSKLWSNKRNPFRNFSHLSVSHNVQYQRASQVRCIRIKLKIYIETNTNFWNLFLFLVYLESNIFYKNRISA
jgi:hypothetical protein